VKCKLGSKWSREYIENSGGPALERLLAIFMTTVVAVAKNIDAKLDVDYTSRSTRPSKKVEHRSTTICPSMT
jgi:hypothetical protein